MEKLLPAFKENNPQLEVETLLHRGRHPWLKGFYGISLSLSNSRGLYCGSQDVYDIVIMSFISDQVLCISGE